jgi:hypothetical protein
MARLVPSVSIADTLRKMLTSSGPKGSDTLNTFVDNLQQALSFFNEAYPTHSESVYPQFSLFPRPDWAGPSKVGLLQTSVHVPKRTPAIGLFGDPKDWADLAESPRARLLLDPKKVVQNVGHEYRHIQQTAISQKLHRLERLPEEVIRNLFNEEPYREIQAALKSGKISKADYLRRYARLPLEKDANLFGAKAAREFLQWAGRLIRTVK